MDYATCEAKMKDEKMLGLAMFNFVQNSDESNRLNRLHDKLQEYDSRVSDLLMRQEELVKNASRETAREEYLTNYKEEENGDYKYTNRVMRCAKLDMYSRVMNTTIQVKRELESLREYAAQVIELEKERNALIDYVFSLPEKERVIGIEILENIKARAESRKKQVENVNGDMGQIGKLVVESKEKKCLGHQLKEAINSMEHETVSLLSLTEEQRNVYTDEVHKLKRENDKLSTMITLVEDKSNSEVRMLEEKCNEIAQDLDEVKHGLEKEVQEKMMEIANLETQLRDSGEQSLELEEQLMDLKNSIDAIVNENEMLNHTLSEAMKHNHDVDIICGEMENLKGIINEQRDQIKNLMLIICNMSEEEGSSKAENKESLEEASPVEINLNEIIEECSKEKLNENLKNENPETFFETCTDNDKTEEPIDSGMASRSEVEMKNTLPSDCTNFPETISVNGESVQSENEVRPSTRTTEIESTSKQSSVRGHTDFMCSSIPKLNISEYSRSRPLRKIFKHTIPDKMTTTSLRVESYNKFGVKECMNAVLESTSTMDGVLEMSTPSKLHLRLQCTSPIRNESSNKKLKSDFTIPNTEVCQNCEKSKQDVQDIGRQINQIKDDMAEVLQQPCGKKSIISDIKGIYSQMFGGNTESG